MLQQDKQKHKKHLHISAARRIKNSCILLQPFLPSDSWPWCSHGAARHMGQLRALICRQQLMQTGCLQFNARTPAAMARLRLLQDNHCPKLNHNMCTYHECSSHPSTTGFFRFPWVCFQPESWIDVPSYYSNFRCPHVPPCAHAGFPTDSHRVQVLKSWIQIWDH